MSAPVGSILARREPEGDAWDRIRVLGVHELGADYRSELVIAPADEFDSPVTADGDAIWAVYDTERSAPPAAPFETPLREVTVRG